jgi:hypothetical protein
MDGRKQGRTSGSTAERPAERNRYKVLSAYNQHGHHAGAKRVVAPDAAHRGQERHAHWQRGPTVGGSMRSAGDATAAGRRKVADVPATDVGVGSGSRVAGAN